MNNYFLETQSSNIEINNKDLKKGLKMGVISLLLYAFVFTGLFDLVPGGEIILFFSLGMCGLAFGLVALISLASFYIFHSKNISFLVVILGAFLSFIIPVIISLLFGFRKKSIISYILLNIFVGGLMLLIFFIFIFKDLGNIF